MSSNEVFGHPKPRKRKSVILTILLIVAIMIIVIITIVIVLGVLVARRIAKVLGNLGDDCIVTDDCVNGLLCRSGKCYPSVNCVNDDDCRDDELCNAGKCENDY